MSVSKWTYHPSKCDGDFCPGDCDFCAKGDIIIEEGEEYDEECNKENLLSRSKTKAEGWFKYKSMIYCPKCASGFDAAMMSDYNYCPNCGVKLSEE